MVIATAVRLATRMADLGTESAFEVLARARQLEREGHHIIHMEIGGRSLSTHSFGKLSDGGGVPDARYERAELEHDEPLFLHGGDVGKGGVAQKKVHLFLRGGPVGLGEHDQLGVAVDYLLPVDALPSAINIVKDVVTPCCLDHVGEH